MYLLCNVSLRPVILKVPLLFTATKLYAFTSLFTSSRQQCSKWQRINVQRRYHDKRNRNSFNILQPNVLENVFGKNNPQIKLTLLFNYTVLVKEVETAMFWLNLDTNIYTFTKPIIVGFLLRMKMFLSLRGKGCLFKCLYIKPQCCWDISLGRSIYRK